MTIPSAAPLPFELPEPPSLDGAPDYYKARSLYEDQRELIRIRAEAEHRAEYAKALAQQTVKIDQLGELVHALANRIENLRDDVTRLRGELARIGTRVQEQGDELRRLRERIDAIEADLCALRARMSALEEQGERRGVGP